MVNLDAPIELSERTIIGKKLAGLRHGGQVPAVIHNHGQESVYVSADEVALDKVYREAGRHHPLNLKVGSQDFLALIKDAHYNPVSRKLEHVVFQAIRQDEAVEAQVPIVLEGDAPAEKAGLMVLHQLHEINIEALPKDLPDVLKVDATKLAELGDKIAVADLTVPAGVKILEEAEHPIASVVETKAQISEEESAEGEEGAEGEEAGAEGEEKPAEGSATEEPKE